MISRMSKYGCEEKEEEDNNDYYSSSDDDDDEEFEVSCTYWMLQDILRSL